MSFLDDEKNTFTIAGLVAIALIVAVGFLCWRGEDKVHAVAYQGTYAANFRERGFYAALALQGIIDRDPIAQSSEERILQVREALQYSDILLQLARTEGKP